MNNPLSLKQKARLAGVLYLVIIVCAGFAEGVARQSLIVPADAATTAANLQSSAGLYRIGLAGDLVAFMCDIGVSILLYHLLKPVGKMLSLTAAAFRLIAHPAIGSLNLVNHYAALHVLQDPGFSSAFGPEQLAMMSMGFLEAHHTGYLIAGAFFGVHCLLLGYLLYRSELFPKVLGGLLGFASLGYLVESFGFILFPEYQSVYASLVAVSAGLGEVALCLWLLIKGVKDSN